MKIHELADKYYLYLYFIWTIIIYFNIPNANNSKYSITLVIFPRFFFEKFEVQKITEYIYWIVGKLLRKYYIIDVIHMYILTHFKKMKN